MKREPVLITGFPRSGTTLLRMMLDSHPRLAVPFEVVGLWMRYSDRLSEFGELAEDADVRRLVDDLLSEDRIRMWRAELGPDDVLRRLSPDPEYRDVVAAFYEAYAASFGNPRWGDKHPGAPRRLARMRAWFPTSKVVHLVRDGRDACRSLVDRSFGPDHLIECARLWREYILALECVGTVLGPDYLEIRFEDLVTEPEPTLERVCDFLSLRYSGQMLEYPERVRETVPPSKRDLWPILDEPPQASAAFRWKDEMSEGARVCFEKRAGEQLEDLGYEVIPGSPSGAYLWESRRLVRRMSAAVRRRMGARSWG